MDGYKLFRRDRQGRRGGRVALYVRECFSVVELNAGNCQVLMGRDQGKVDEADILESAIDHPTSMKRQTKCSVQLSVQTIVGPCSHG